MISKEQRGHLLIAEQAEPRGGRGGGPKSHRVRFLKITYASRGGPKRHGKGDLVIFRQPTRGNEWFEARNARVSLYDPDTGPPLVQSDWLLRRVQ